MISITVNTYVGIARHMYVDSYHVFYCIQDWLVVLLFMKVE